MARHILNRKDLRADYDAAERRQQDGAEEQADAAEEKDQAGVAEVGGEGAAEPQPEAAPKKKKAAKPAKPRSRTRTPKVSRMRIVWGVFNNSNQRVAVFDYARRQEADELAAKLRTDKRSTHFVQPVKEPIEEKVEK